MIKNDMKLRLTRDDKDMLALVALAVTAFAIVGGLTLTLMKLLITS